MKAFFYYVGHTLKNQIRKLFKTWVAILLLVCFGFGLLVGLGAALLFPEEEDTAQESVEEEEWTAADTEKTMEIAELVIGGVVLLLLGFNAISADKNGCAIFQPADVNLLFPSPMKPQSVLLFRLMTQIGTSILVSIYFITQLPSLARNMGLTFWATATILLAWLLLLILGRFLQVLLYALCATHPRVKARLRPTLLVLALAIAGAFTLYWKSGSATPLDAAVSFFNAPVTRYIPVWGWLKGCVMFAIEGNILGTLLSLLGVLVAMLLLVFIIYRTRVDFYEDAMAKSQETAEIQERAQNEGKTLTKRKKDRSERLRRDGLRGTGASVFFHKAMYNRFRFAHLRVFTKTSETYLVIAIGGALTIRYMNPMMLVPFLMVLPAMVFFRSLGNPISDDTQKDLFVMIPENAWKKVFCSMAGGILNTLLDILPALIAITLILWINPLIPLAIALFCLSVDFYSSAVGLFLDVSLPTSMAPTVKGIVQIMFVYFGLLPDVVLLLVGSLFSIFPLMFAIACLVNLAIGALFASLSPLFIEYGRK